MRILFVCNEYPPNQYGGIGSFTKLIAEYLALNNFSVFVVGYADVKERKTEIINNVTILWIPRPVYGKSKFLNILKQLISRFIFYKIIRKEIKQREIQIIESYDYGGPLIFKPKNVKLVVRLHGSHTANNYFMNRRGSLLLRLLEKCAIKNADNIVGVSEHIVRLTKEAFKLEFQYERIYNGVDLELFSEIGIERDLNRLLLVGRMHPYKGFDRLFRCLNFLFALNKEVNLEVICTIVPEYKEFLMSLVDRNYHSRINFVGRVDNNELVQFYNKASLLVLPSVTEALAIIPLESMACGTPVIMTNGFTAPEIITDNIDGVLVDTADAIGFASRINDTLKFLKLSNKMRVNAKRKVKTKFEIGDIILQNMSFYKRVLND
ncbi:glycosyltransferase family 4 protein [Sphingobacterium siyangense]|uniref:glycosyltransferase family 4 protein n=1 Tax=Sphingobacterium siyangense TaxID=459529 RepID=UPI002FDDEA7B